MNKTLKLAAVYLLTFFVSLSLISNTKSLAVEDETTDSRREDAMERRDARKQEILDKRAEIAANRRDNRCKARLTRLENAQKMFEKTERFHIKRYRALLEKLSNLSTRLNDKGLDTTQLNAYLSELDAKITNLETMYADFLLKVENLAALPCDPALKEGWNNSLRELGEDLAILKTTSKEIRDYISETIKPELKDLKQQLASENSNEESSESSEGEGN